MITFRHIVIGFRLLSLLAIISLIVLYALKSSIIPTTSLVLLVMMSVVSLTLTSLYLNK